VKRRIVAVISTNLCEIIKSGVNRYYTGDFSARELSEFKTGIQFRLIFQLVMSNCRSVQLKRAILKEVLVWMT
jgi:hypothetical protein